MNREYRAAYASEPENVALARRGIAGFAADCGFSQEDISDIRLAVGEALSNAVEHGCAVAAREIVVKCTCDDDELAIEIEDRGSAFRAPSDQSRVAPDDRGRGFGIFLMRRLMDEVSFEPDGTVIRLVRHR